MSTKAKTQVLDTIRQAWKNTPVEKVCYIIVDKLTGERSCQIREIHESTIMLWTENKFSPETIFEAVHFLSGRNPHLLDIQYILSFTEQDERALNKEELKEIERQGYIEHPLTYEPIPNYEDYIYFYYKPSILAKSLIQ